MKPDCLVSVNVTDGLTVLSGFEGAGGLGSTACRCARCQVKCVRLLLLKTTHCERLAVRIVHELSEGTCWNKPVDLLQYRQTG